MADLLDADWFRASASVAATLATVAAWRYESVRLDRINSVGRGVLWPAAWLLIGAVYASMALALSSDLVSSLGGLGREYARNEDWYESRRPLQVAVVSIVGLAWLTVVVVGVWRVPERRRRYLPSALLCTSLVCFAIIRVVSLHQIDTIVGRTEVVGVPVGTAVGLAGLAVAVFLVGASARRPIPAAATENDAELPQLPISSNSGPLGSES